ncbi:uncharacterized protein EDB91DRAFT_1089989, partial [Suillus paluster]|uniref:uncharacterized protein n=1 Tax=Suillus paluster TaxID=48578 RepID=UPI001B87C44B
SATVEKLLDRAENDDEAAKKKLKELRMSIENCKSDEEGDLAIWAEVIGPLDKHTAVFQQAAKDSLQEMVPAYVGPLSTYRQHSVATLKKAWLSSGKGTQGGDNHIFQHLDRVIARVMLHLTPDEDEVQAPETVARRLHARLRLVEGVAEICRWFEPLLDYWRILHAKNHVMDDWTTVMFANIQADLRFKVKGVDVLVADTIWMYRDSLVLRLHNAMMTQKRKQFARPSDKDGLKAGFDSLSPNEQTASEALTMLITKKRALSASGTEVTKNLSNESQVVAGTMALHCTSWDWLSPALRNVNRDIAPCVQAIAYESSYILKYRPALLKDQWIGALRCMLENDFTERVMSFQTIDENGKLRSMKRWLWWDRLPLSSKQQDPATVVGKIKDSSVIRQQQQQQRLTLENADRDALTKAINTIAGLNCAKVLGDGPTLMSTDVLTPLQALVEGLQLNSARRRMRILSGDNEKHFNAETDIDDLKIVFPAAEADEHTTYPAADDDDTDKEEQPLHVERDGSHIDAQKESSVPATDEGPARENSPPATPAVPRTIPKPRPKPRRQRQPSPVPMLIALPATDDDVDQSSSTGHRASSVVPVPPEPQRLDVVTLSSALATVASATTAQVALETIASTTVEQPVDAVQPTAELATVVPADDQTDISECFPGSLPPLTQSSPPGTPLDGFATSDVSWFKNGRESEEDDTNADIAEARDPLDESYHPTQGLTQPIDAADTQVRRSARRHPSPAHAPAATKRSRAATGSSVASTSSSNGKQKKKKARFTTPNMPDDDEDELIVLPNV